MRYIDKSNKSEEGRAVNLRFLKDNFDSETGKIGISLNKSAYEKYRVETYSGVWRRLLCEQQDNLCCYCMRDLGSGEDRSFSAEHVIPVSLRGDEDRTEFLRYVTGEPCAQSLASNVEYSDDTEQRTFATAEDLEMLEKIPHVIAHHNFLAACKGIRSTKEYGCCCNNKRGREFLMPYMLIPDGADRFRYDANGLVSISPKDDSWKIILEELNGDTFQEIRYIWRMVAKNTKYRRHHFAYDTSELQRMQIFKTAFKTNNYLSIREKYRNYAGKIMDRGNEFTWRLLVDYIWFLEYYRR